MTSLAWQARRTGYPFAVFRLRGARKSTFAAMYACNGSCKTKFPTGKMRLLSPRNPFCQTCYIQTYMVGKAAAEIDEMIAHWKKDCRKSYRVHGQSKPAPKCRSKEYRELENTVQCAFPDARKEEYRLLVRAKLKQKVRTRRAEDDVREAGS